MHTLLALVAPHCGIAHGPSVRKAKLVDLLCFPSKIGQLMICHRLMEALEDAPGFRRVHWHITLHESVELQQRSSTSVKLVDQVHGRLMGGLNSI